MGPKWKRNNAKQTGFSTARALKMHRYARKITANTPLVLWGKSEHPCLLSWLSGGYHMDVGNPLGGWNKDISEYGFCTPQTVTWSGAKKPSATSYRCGALVAKSAVLRAKSKKKKKEIYATWCHMMPQTGTLIEHLNVALSIPLHLSQIVLGQDSEKW